MSWEPFQVARVVRKSSVRLGRILAIVPNELTSAVIVLTLLW